MHDATMTELLEYAIERVRTLSPELRPMRRTLASPYLIFYVATENEIVVVGIRHGARDPATMPNTPRRPA
ncbi:type II toxin-antitoxin system RelE/ParE family toxin [Methylobacterium ajmalii]|nr:MULTISPECIES: type II toxin-antitoxin system RelE/ParE family toxin [Methylobacterium]MBZ6416559.1 type II toxin-antitoxin system RelE/ParE family toxin [Methylobacterium sp.]